MAIHGFDDANNKVVVPTKAEFDSLGNTVGLKQVVLNATQGVTQEDCNDLKTTGVYYISAASDNRPSNHNYVIFVLSLDDDNTTVKQEGLSTDGNYVYTRLYLSGGWTPWKRWCSYDYYQANTSSVTYGSTMPSRTTGKDGDIFYRTQVSNGVTSVVGCYLKVNGEWVSTISDATVLPQAEGGGF